MMQLYRFRRQQGRRNRVQIQARTALLCLVFLALAVLKSQAVAGDETAPAPGAVRCVAFRSDGKLLATGGDDTVVKLWDLRTGKIVHYLIGHNGAVRAVAFSPDGKTLASRSTDGTVMVWNTENGELARTFPVASPRASVLVFRPDGKQLAVDGQDFSIVLLEVATGKTLTTLHAHTKVVTCAAFSGDGKWLATGSADTTVRIWAMDTGAPIHIMTPPGGGWINAVAFQPGSNVLASAGDADAITLWNLETEQAVRTISGYHGSINGLAFRSDGQSLAAAGSDDTIRVWSMSAQPAQSFRGPPGSWTSLSFRPDGGALAAGHSANQAQIWSLTDPKAKLVLQTSADEPHVHAALWNQRGMAAKHDGNHLQAIDYFHRAAGLNMAEPSYSVHEAEAHLNAWQFEAGVKLILARLPQFPTPKARKALQTALADGHDRWGWNLQQKRLYQDAIAHYETAYNLYRSLLPTNAADQLGSIARCYEALNLPERAKVFYERQLGARRQSGDKNQEADTLNSLARLFHNMSHYEQALDYHRQALDLRRAIRDRSGEGATLNNLAIVYSSLGDNARALDYYQQALAIHREVKASSNEISELSNIGWTYAKLGRHNEALGYFEQALLLARSAKERSSEAYLLSNEAMSYDALGQHTHALALCREALAISQALEEKDAFIPLKLGAIYLSLQQPAQARETLQTALVLARQSKDPDTEARVLYQLMRAEHESKQFGMAIFYGKQAVNRYQEIRRFLQKIDKALKQTFVNSKQQTYRQLADLLIAQGRLPEAEQVLGMLKEEEFFDFIRRDQGQANALNTQVPYSSTEAEWERRYREISDRVTAIGLEYDVLKSKENRTLEEEKKLLAFGKDVVVANTAFTNFLASLRRQFIDHPSGGEAVGRLQASSGLQAALHDLGPGTVALFTLVGEKSYRVILVTAKTRKAAEYPISAADLSKKVLDFRGALQNPNLDPRPLAQELYQILIGPIAKDIENAAASGVSVETLMWSLDGVLRYIPTGALYDGKQYLVQRFRQSVFTTESLPYLKDAPSAQWHALGLGVSQGSGETGRDGYFAPLPGVVEELRGIIADGSKDKRQGILPGLVKLDDDFTEAALTDELSKHSKLWPVVHIASHFQFRPGDMHNSFLLLGKGKHLALDVIENMPSLFSGVELLTLSACNTANGASIPGEEAGKGGDGNEVDSFGMLAQSQGAKAVVATLWPVADKSTALLMQKFYDIRASKSPITKGEALRKAQCALLEGKAVPPPLPLHPHMAPQSGLVSTNSIPQDRAEIVKSNSTASHLPAFTSDPNAPYAHPYYWAPFILIGNWK